MRSHPVRFPRYVDDIVSKKRTLMHIPIAGDVATRISVDSAETIELPHEPFEVGDIIEFHNGDWKPNRTPPRVLIGTVVAASVVALEVNDADLPLLNVETAVEYLERWDSLMPDSPASLRPQVWRVEWVYGYVPPAISDWALSG